MHPRGRDALILFFFWGGGGGILLNFYFGGSKVRIIFGGMADIFGG